MSINIRKSNCQKRDEILIFEDYKTFPVSDTEEGKARIIKDSLLEKFDTVKNDEELQLLQNRYNQFDKLYVKYSCTYDSDSHREIQESIEIIYQKVKNYLDRGFKKKFQKNFSERLWEMYLINFFIEKKFDIEDRIADSGPDIKIKLPNKKILWIEAVIANRGEGRNFVPPIPLGSSGGDVDEIDFPKILRLTSSIKYKYQKYFDSKYDGYVKDSGIRKGDFFVIAICSDFEDFDERCILNTLFSLGKTIYRRSKNGNLEGPFYEYCPSIEKHNGVDISTNIFESDDYRNLSGIIYSSRRVIDIIDDSKWKDFYFCFNPKAINHLERMDFNFCRHIYKKNGLVSMKICDS